MCSRLRVNYLIIIRRIRYSRRRYIHTYRYVGKSKKIQNVCGCRVVAPKLHFAGALKLVGSVRVRSSNTPHIGFARDCFSSVMQITPGATAECIFRKYQRCLWKRKPHEYIIYTAGTGQIRHNIYTFPTPQ